MSRIRNWRVVLGQAVAGGVGSILALTLVGWPDNAAETAWVGLGGFLVGLALAFAVEYVARLHLDVRRLRHAERQLEAERQQREEERRLWSYQLVLERRRFAVSEVNFKVYADALREADPGGQVVPLAALIARVQVHQQAQGIDKPMPPLDEWQAPPPGQPL